MKKVIGLILALSLCLSGCGATGGGNSGGETASSRPVEQKEQNDLELTDEVTELESGLSAVKFTGDDGFEDFLSNGGAASDREVIDFLGENLLPELGTLSGLTGAFGCSTLLVENMEGGYYFGRNFDWNQCEALIVEARPETGYASLSTVNTDFIRQGAGALSAVLEQSELLTLAALYAPLDGMNEMGLAVSVNMIQDGDTIEQDTKKPDITTTTAVRLLLNKAANVEEAVELLKSYDLHASFGYMVHFALADADGNSVCVEYIGNEMSVVETPVVTNFYLTEGEKFGVGTSQSHERYEILTSVLDEKKTMSADDVRDALSSVSKGNFGEFESTEWSAVFDLERKTARYYHRENYEISYDLSLN